MAEIFTTHEGRPVAGTSRGHVMLKPVVPDSSPRMPAPPNAGQLRKIGKAKRKAQIAERAREMRNRARTFATGVQ
jgi:hypothetical protein